MRLSDIIINKLTMKVFLLLLSLSLATASFLGGPVRAREARDHSFNAIRTTEVLSIHMDRVL